MKKKLFAIALALVMIVGGGGNSVAGTSNLVRWEYKLVDGGNLHNLRTAEDVVDFLNSLGSDGWELALETMNGLIFKRPDLRTEAERARAEVEAEERSRIHEERAKIEAEEAEERARIREERAKIEAEEAEERARIEAAEREERARITKLTKHSSNIVSQLKGLEYSGFKRHDETFNPTIESLSKGYQTRDDFGLNTPGLYVVEQINGHWFVGYNLVVAQETPELVEYFPELVEYLKQIASEHQLLGDVESYIETFTVEPLMGKTIKVSFDQNSLYDGQDVVFIHILIHPYRNRVNVYRW